MSDSKAEVERILMLDLEEGTWLQNIERKEWDSPDCRFNSYVYEDRVTVAYSCFIDELNFQTFWKRYAPRP